MKEMGDNTTHDRIVGKVSRFFLSGEIPNDYFKPERNKSSKQKWDETIIWYVLVKKR